MCVEKFIKNIIPPFVFDIIFYFRVFIHKWDCKPFKKVPPNSIAIIIGNGPSLNSTIESYESILKMNDCFMVNHSIESDYFDLIKPKNYVVVDPYYFQKGPLNKKAELLINSLNNKLKWDMSFYVPYHSKNSTFVNELSKNSLVKIEFFNSVSPLYATGISNKTFFKLWNKNTASPLTQTVLNAATSIAISKRYNEIYLVGADTSWIEMIIVDQETNDLYSQNKHFYKNDKYLISSYNEEKSNLAVELGCIKKAFEAYQVLKEYANYNGCNVYNASDYSLIDTIVRKKL